ncbi:sugar phosphate isomerase/epimerase family protein [Alkalihalophilus marmarensis]|uniref:sugar phosphate isomerase/epimerase family protein n=1 Tax=Alkalihalophilus marmarensis TaxID=521377 RepID=UPI002DB8104D|nr:sugar phosphate isomerase/epimerase family protein [Alkalihalophilus marmarensis]MEC2071934.1 sugar phosphate isomerase/epimerase [Alkalihalophilus marmarensis]
MNVSLCTITFRHHLHSLQEITTWASDQGFNGIELWAVHAKNAIEDAAFHKKNMAGKGLAVSMLSDYLPLNQSVEQLMKTTERRANLLKLWGTNKLRTFAGQKASGEVTAEERSHIVKQLQAVCRSLAVHNQLLLIETHPNTLADTLESTSQLIEEVDHQALRINYDALHMWEAGVDPAAGFIALEPYIEHVHLKNITSRDHLRVFAPENVYAAAGTREGMIPLFEGCIDYQRFFRLLSDSLEKVDVSLEWFGEDVFSVLTNDLRQLLKVNQRVGV